MERPLLRKTQLLVIGPAGHYVMRNLDSLRDRSDVCISNDPMELERLAGDAEVILFSGLGGAAVDLRRLWPYARGVRWVHSLAAGVEKVLFPELIASAVPLTNARGVFKRSLAEFAVLGILFHTKKVRRLIENQRARRWDDFNVSFADRRIMGVVGFGEIGRECALLAKGLGLTIHALRRNPQRSAADALAERVFGPDQLHEMLSGIDVLLCAAPLTTETRHMIGDAEFGAMKPTAIVVNVGRGPVIDEAALVRALGNARIAGASLDVFEHEPLPEASPLWGMDNVLISPHCTDRTDDPDWLDLSMQAFTDNLRRFQNGEPLQNVVDKHAGY
jgi:phosphoglycerate dehydrogenase-like enzyme